jgi:opacity protein-like surface antigen
VGTYLSSDFTVDGSFTYSNFYIDRTHWRFGQPVYDELDQYNITAAVKYAPILGAGFSPQVGIIGGYTQRNYNEQVYCGTACAGISSSAESSAFDFGFVAGLDIRIGKSFVIGGEYRYMTNLTYKTDSPYLGPAYRAATIGKPLEEFDYSTFAIVGKILF